MSDWISVEDKMPKLPGKNEVYECASFLVTDGVNVGICDYQWGNGCGRPWSDWSAYGDVPHDLITNWMPLPKPPKH